MLAHNHTCTHLKSHALTQNDNQHSMYASLHVRTLNYTGKHTGFSLCFFYFGLCPSPPSSLLLQKSSRQAARLDSRPIRLVSSNRISWERERDDKPICCRTLSLLKYITHSKWSCWSQTAVDLITPRALCGCGTF